MSQDHPPKVHRADANYRKATGKQRCRNCASMNADGTCDKVYGLVRPEDVCDLWSARK